MAFFKKSKQKQEVKPSKIKKVGESQFEEFLSSDSKSFDDIPDLPSRQTDTQPVDEFDARILSRESAQQARHDVLEMAAGLRPNKERKNNIGEFRLNVARVTSDFDNGEELYRRAQQRITNMMDFVEQAEVDFALLDRLEPENRRLKAQNRTLDADIKTKTHKISVMDADLEDHRRRLTEVKAQYEISNGNLSKAIKTLADRDREIVRLTTEVDALKLKYERQLTASDVETRENEILRDRICTLSDELEDSKTQRMTLSKLVETLRIDCEDLRISKDILNNESHELRSALDSTTKQNNQMKGEMVSLHEEISTFKTQYEFNIIGRDDRIFSLETQIEEVNKQLVLKDEMIANSAREISDLRKNRTANELERERLEKAIDSQNQQLSDAHSQLVDSKENIDALDRRYKDVERSMVSTLERVEKVDKENVELRELNAEISNLKSELSIKENLVQRCNDQITSLTKQKNNFERTLAVAKDQTQTLERKAALDKSDYEAQIAKLETDLEQQDTENSFEYQGHIKELTLQNKDLETNLSIAEDRLIRAEEKHEFDATKYQTQINNLIGELETRHKEDARDSADYESQILELMTQNRELESRLGKATLDIEASNANEASSVSKYVDKISELTGRLKAQEKSTSEELARYEDKVSTLTQREKELEHALANAASKVAPVTNADHISEYERKIDALTEQLDVKNEIVATAASDVEELRRLQAEQDKQSEALKLQIQGQTLELDKALDELSKSQENMKELDERYKNVTAELKQAQTKRESSKPSKTPDIAPPPLPKKKASVKSDEISLKDRILGYKLGNR